MEYKDYYQLLGVPKSASEKEIKRAYRKLAQQYHPDRNPNNKAAEEKFKEINEAYEVLGNPANRQKYDQLGVNYHRFKQMGGNPGDFDFSQWFSQGGRPGQNVNVDLGDLFGGGGGFSDFFNTIFGGQARQRTTNAPFGRQAPKLDLEKTITISLEEAYHGTEVTFDHHGSTLTAKIPPGAKTGTKIRLRGKGYVGTDGTQGDLYLLTKVKPHSVFERVGNSLRVTVAAPVTTAVLGGKIPVPTLTGNVNLTVPAGTQGGQTFRLSGKGMPHLHENSRYGDLLATIHIEIPQTLTPAEEEHYQALARLAAARAANPHASSA